MQKKTVVGEIGDSLGSVGDDGHWRVQGAGRTALLCRLLQPLLEVGYLHPGILQLVRLTVVPDAPGSRREGHHDSEDEEIEDRSFAHHQQDEGADDPGRDERAENFAHFVTILIEKIFD